MQSVQELEMEENDTSNNTTLLLVRPLLSLRKQDLYYDYLKSNNYTWREDESNAENKYQRNKVRNQLIPLYWKNLLVEQTFSKNGCSHINNKVRKFTTT
jgi:tRNA(Ile)-lysidine synthase TilS/MesJ